MDECKKQRWNIRRCFQAIMMSMHVADRRKEIERLGKKMKEAKEIFNRGVDLTGSRTNDIK
jgi:hypothetical protein